MQHPAVVQYPPAPTLVRSTADRCARADSQTARHLPQRMQKQTKCTSCMQASAHSCTQVPGRCRGCARTAKQHDGGLDAVQAVQEEPGLQVEDGRVQQAVVQVVAPCRLLRGIPRHLRPSHIQSPPAGACSPQAPNPASNGQRRLVVHARPQPAPPHLHPRAHHRHAVVCDQTVAQVVAPCRLLLASPGLWLAAGGNVLMPPAALSSRADRRQTKLRTAGSGPGGSPPRPAQQHRPAPAPMQHAIGPAWLMTVQMLPHPALPAAWPSTWCIHAPFGLLCP